MAYSTEGAPEIVISYIPVCGYRVACFPCCPHGILAAYRVFIGTAASVSARTTCVRRLPTSDYERGVPTI